METVYSKDIKDAANLMADDLVVVCVFETITIALLLTVVVSFPDSWDRQELARAMYI